MYGSILPRSLSLKGYGASIRGLHYLLLLYDCWVGYPQPTKDGNLLEAGGQVGTGGGESAHSTNYLAPAEHGYISGNYASRA